MAEELTVVALPNTVWGPHPAADIVQICCSIYDEVVYWRINIFKLPSGAVGKRSIKEMTRLIELWNEDVKPTSDIALKMLMIMILTLLQKPSKKSTTKMHKKYLEKRLDLWDSGKFDELMAESRAIQQRLRQNSSLSGQTPEHKAKTFARLIFQGKVNPALKMLERNSALGVANLTDETLRQLKNLHPEAEPAHESTYLLEKSHILIPSPFTTIMSLRLQKLH